MWMLEDQGLSITSGPSLPGLTLAFGAAPHLYSSRELGGFGPWHLSVVGTFHYQGAGAGSNDERNKAAPARLSLLSKGDTLWRP